MKKKPNFLIVGAAKSGSTSLYQYLNQHPEIFMPVNKEPNYFVAEYQKLMNVSSPNYKRSRDQMVFEKEKYYELFEKANSQHKCIGEATVTYLYKHEYAIKKIKCELKNPKIIIILRNPIKRAFSQYSYIKEMGFENLSFAEAIKQEKKRLKNNWSSTFAYTDQGMFYNQVKAYLENFDNVHILLLDDLMANKELEIKKIFNFLNVNDDFNVNFTKKYNVSGVPKFKALHNFSINKSLFKSFLKKIFPNQTLRNLNLKLRSLNQSYKLQLNLDDKNYLRMYYRKEILELGKLINRDLSHWL